ncbi:MAG: hypothetical protein WC972_08380, partial [Trueperaceae bacterium]
DILLYGLVPNAEEVPQELGEHAAPAPVTLPEGPRGANVIAKLPARLAGRIEVGVQHDFFVQPGLVKSFDPVSGHRVDAATAA